MPGAVWVLMSLLATAPLGNWEAGGLAIAFLGGIAVALAAVLELQGSATDHREDARKATLVQVAPSESHMALAVSLLGCAERISRWMAANELWIVLLLGPLFLLPRRSFVLVFAIIPLLWISRWQSRGTLTKRTPFDWPIALLLLMLSVSILVSVDVVASLPKLAGILWGIAVFYAIVNRVQTEQEIRWVLVGLGGAGIAVALIGVLGTQWIVSGKFIPEKVYSLLPRLTINIPGTVEGWIHPNEVGGSLAFIVPFLVTLLVPRWYVLPTNGASSSFLSRLGPFQLRWGLRISLAFSFAVLILSQSRSAIVGVLVSLLVLGAILWRRFRWIVAGIAIVLLLVLSLRGFAPLGTVLVGPGGEGGVAGTLGLADRQEVWERALFAIQDFPFTGLGLNMFGPVSRVIYPYFLVSPDDQLLLTHAHDVYLQVAVDLGIPGLVAYFALLTALGYMVTDVFIHSPSAFSRAVALAVGLGILAHQIFGIADAIALGAKPGIILWMMLALLATVWQRNMSRVKTTNSAS